MSIHAPNPQGGADLSAGDFSWEEFFWRARVELPSWVGLQSPGGGDEQPGRRLVTLTYAPEGRGDEPLAVAEVAQAAWVLSHERELFEAVVEILVENYSSLRELYSYVPSAVMPEAVTSEDDLRSLVVLHGVHVHNIFVPGLDPYVGFEFGCEWDEEHGLGVLMCGRRCVAIGGADTALLKWMAERDAAEQ